MGYFEFSRAYTRDIEPGKMPHILCARQVPDWIPAIAFKQIFKDNFKEFMSSRSDDGLPPGISTMREFKITVRKPTSKSIQWRNI